MVVVLELPSALARDRARARATVEAILDGTQPVALTPERLKRARELPLLWEEQRAMLGVGELEGGDLRRRSGAGSEARRGEVA